MEQTSPFFKSWSRRVIWHSHTHIKTVTVTVTHHRYPQERWKLVANKHELLVLEVGIEGVEVVS